MTARTINSVTDSMERPGRPHAAAAAAWIGSALEYYDFFIYGSASALVFAKVFFSASDPATATLQSLATFGVAYAARPIGALILGHVGDRFGRKRIMVLTVALMGLSTFLIGLLPTRAQVGGVAPWLLVALRVLQGLSAAGEQPSANSMSLENAPDRRRGYFTSFTLGGTQAGQAIAALVFIPVASMPEHDLLTWGWRIPFLASALVTVTAFVIRRELTETPAFEQEAAEGATARLPLAYLLRHHWAAVIRVLCCALIATVQTIFTVWVVSYATGGTIKMNKTAMLWVTVCANLVALAAIPLWAILSDRIGRKPVFLLGALGSPIMIFAYLAVIPGRSLPLIFLMGILTFGVVYSAANAVWPSFYGEMFPTKVRLSGTAIGTQIGFALAGFAVATAAGINTKHGWLGLQGPHGVGVFCAVICAISAVSALTARETSKVATSRLGERQETVRAAAARVAERPQGQA